jgi:hypothetical protein
MQSCSHPRSQTSQAPFLSPQPPPHTPAWCTLVSLNTPSLYASTINLPKIKGSLTDPTPTCHHSALRHIGLMPPLVSLLLNFIGSPTCLTLMRTAMCLIRLPFPMWNHWHFCYLSMTLLIILISHLRLWTILTVLRPLATQSHLLQNYAAQCAVA